MALLAPVALVAQSPFVNPVIPKPGMHAEVADPYVLKWNGEYYLYTSGNPITAYHSEDLVHWDFIGPVLSASTDPKAWNQSDVWAPEVVYRNGKFYMYYTASLASPDWRVGEMGRRIGVAVAESPRGPFVDIGRPVTPGWGIDGHVFKDPDNGQEYFFYSYLYEPRHPGAGIVADRMTAWDKVAGAPSHVTRGTEAWEDKDGDPNNGSLRYTNEAPTVLKHHGKYYMMYSGGSWDLPTYALAYATADQVLNSDLQGPGWSKVVPPILRSTPLVDAPGHHTVTKAPNNVDDICVYHARVIPFLEPWNRLPFVDRLYWNHDRMFMQQPSLGAMSAPDQPLFRDNFNRADGVLGTGWKPASGDWRISGKQALQSRTQPGRAVAAVDAEALVHYVLEANVRISPTPKAGSRAGVVAVSLASGHHVDVLLDAAQRALVVASELPGVPVSQKTAPLPEGFEPHAYHQLLVTRDGDRLAVAVDGVTLYTGVFAFKGAASQVALLADGARADFDGVALTSFFDDTFDVPEFNWTTQSGTWLAESGALHQVAGGNAPAIALKGDATEDYEFTASVLWRDADSVTSKAGIVAAAEPSGDMVVAGFDRNIWPLARFWVQRVIGGKVQESYAVGLPRGFKYDTYHTIRVLKQGSGFTFFLDGAEISSNRFELKSARPGLYTEGVRAAFDDARLKRLVVPANLLLNGSFETEQWDASKPIAGNPWKLSGSAREHYCCAHTGLRRLLLRDTNGSASQAVSGLAPGVYVLQGWAITSAGAQVTINAGARGAAASSAVATGEQWKRFSLTFEVPPTGGDAEVAITAVLQPGQHVAVDDLYLHRQPSTGP